MDHKFKPLPHIIDTQHPSPLLPNALSDEEKMATIATHFQSIMETLGLDVAHPSLQETPQRVAKMFVREIFSGLKQENFPELSIVDIRPDPLQQQETISASTSFVSFCEHHFVPIFGKAFVAYIPHHKVIGLSKIPRIVRYYAQRPQLQERLGLQIHDTLSTILETKSVAVILIASHACVRARGVQDQDSEMRTSIYTGEFETNRSKLVDFLSFVKKD